MNKKEERTAYSNFCWVWYGYQEAIGPDEILVEIIKPLSAIQKKFNRMYETVEYPSQWLTLILLRWQNETRKDTHRSQTNQPNKPHT